MESHGVVLTGGLVAAVVFLFYLDIPEEEVMIPYVRNNYNAIQPQYDKEESNDFG